MSRNGDPGGGRKVSAGRIVPFDHTGDVGFTLEAERLEQLFDLALRALVDLMFLTPPRSGGSAHRVGLEAGSLEALLVAWINELLYLIQTLGRVPVGVRLGLREGSRGWFLNADLDVAAFEPEAQGWQGEVKSATYHNLEVRHVGGRWSARLVLDV